MKDISFNDIPLLSGLDRINLAKLIPNFEQVEFKSGKIVFRQGDPGDALYIIVAGRVRVFLEAGGGSREIGSLGPRECFGEMALLTDEPRSAGIQAMTDLTLLKLPKDRFYHVIKQHPSLGVNFAGLLASRLHLTDTAASGRKEVVVPGKKLGSLSESQIATVPALAKPVPRYFYLEFLKDKRFLGIVLTAVICFLSVLFLRTTPLRQSHIILIELLLAATVIWSLKIFSYHPVAVALPILAVLFGITSPEKAFSGFSNPSWFMVLGIFAISAAISKTGLLYRLVLLLIKHFPPNYIGQTFGLAFSGLLLTPMIPHPIARATLASPLVMTLSEILGFKKGSKGAVGMAMVCLLGFGQMSFMFMNGGSICFLVLGLLPSAVSSSVTWGYWLKGALPLGAFFFLCSYLAVILFYHPKETIKLNPLVIEAQLKTLGPLTTHEKISIITVIVSLLGFLTQPWHHINGAWVAMLCFLILFASSVLDEKAVRADIDWNFLISFGALVGFGNIISASGLTAFIAGAIKPYIEFFIGNKLIFFITIMMAMTIIRFVLPIFPALLVSILTIVPATLAFGLKPFVIGLVVLASADPWFLPYQNWVYLNILQNTEGKLFSPNQTLRLACLQVLIAMAAVAISIPYWKYLNLIR